MALRNSGLLIGSLRKSCVSSSGVFKSLTTRQLSYVVRPVPGTCAQTRDLYPVPTACIHNQPVTQSWSIQFRNYSKSQNISKKGGKHKPQHAVDLDDSTIAEIIDIIKYREDLEKVMEDLKQEYIHNLSLRTNIGMFDRLQVKTKDGLFPLNQIASVVQKNPTLIVLNLTQSIQYVPDVTAALNNSGMNLNIQQEGPTTIYITLSKVSREHREELAKNAKTLFNNAKDKLKHIYSAATRKIKTVKSADVRKTIENVLLQEKQKTQDEAEKMMKAKQKELLG